MFGSVNETANRICGCRGNNRFARLAIVEEVLQDRPVRPIELIGRLVPIFRSRPAKA
jgi:hypothetical protein